MNGTEIIKTLSDGIDMIAKKLGVAADKIYPILMKQTQYNFAMDIMWLIIGIVLLIASIMLTTKIVKSLKNENGYFYHDTHSENEEGGLATFFSFLGIGILYVVSIIMVIDHISEMIQIVINPQYFIFTQYIQPLLQK